MVIRIRDAVKLLGISVIACCAVLVCTMFCNFYLDIRQIEATVLPAQARIFYEAQVATARVVCLVSGGCLLMTSVVMLLFYIKHYIDVHKKELGILKALGYSEWRIAVHFWVFGSGVFAGTAAGFAGAFALMPKFYELQNKEGILPEIAIGFHPELLLYFVILPLAAFALLAVVYAAFQLKKPVLSLLRGQAQALSNKKGGRREAAGPFLDGLRKNTLRTKKTLAFFIFFASFCFSSMTQMSAGMKDLGSEMMGWMILLIGLVLAGTTLFLAITTVIRGNTRTIAMMRVFGYSQKECGRAILGAYRSMACLGFAVGTMYQYVLLRLMVDLVFKDFAGVPVYEPDVPVMLVSLACFAGLYELVMHVYSEKIRKISVKEIMLA